MKEAKDQNNKQPEGNGTGPTQSFNSSVVGPGSKIGHFRIEQELGRGGMGVVYLARDTTLARFVAIKSLPPEVMADRKIRSRLEREAQLLASLSHPNIATIHEEVEETTGAVFLVLEYVPGQTLAERITAGPLKLPEALSIACQIAAALAAAHEHGIIHRDLKPGNIKITPEGNVKVLDFGLAKAIKEAEVKGQQSTVTQPGRVIGSPGYMSPEQARGESTDHHTDIWSFGCVLYEMLTGRCAFPGKTASEALAGILKTDPDWQALPREAVPSVRHIIETCLQKDPEQRYESAIELCQDLRKCQADMLGPAQKAFDLKALSILLRKPRIAVFVAFMVLLLAGGIEYLINRSMKIRWARYKALPQIMKLIEQEQYQQAFLIAQKAERFIPNDPVLHDLWPQMCKELFIITEPPGAHVYYLDYQDYLDSQGKREYLGTTPLKKIRHPLGIFHWEIEKDQYETREYVEAVFPATNNQITILLEPNGRYPEMLPIMREDNGRMFWIDKYEVTNEQFQKFIDDNGYEREEFWEHKFIEDGNVLEWANAMKRFVDNKTKKPGPATWEWGIFPKGQGDYPVRGVSWYEAAAYAKWAGKDLPVLDDWEYGAFPEMRSTIMKDSNIGIKEGPAPVGKFKGMSRFGLYDIAGNVKEWCWNSTDYSNSLRYIRGGSWADSDYAFDERDYQSPMSREVTFGFRCAQYPGGLTSLVSNYVNPVPLAKPRDYLSEPVWSDEEFAIYKKIYDYNDKAPLNDSNDLVEDTRYWRKEKIEFDAAYGNERVTAYLFLPKGAESPYQSVIFFPGLGVVTTKFSSEEKLWDFAAIEFVIKSGRAVLYPVYKGTYERRLPGEIGWSERMSWASKDLGRCIDYIEQRASEQGDIDVERLTYYGLSLGTCISPTLLAVEDRIKSAVLMAGGFLTGDIPENVDPVKFAPHVKIPILMVNGRNDPRFPIEKSVEPMFKLFGTSEKDKFLKPYDGGHGMLGLFYWEIQNDVIKWLDKYPEPGQL